MFVTNRDEMCHLSRRQTPSDDKTTPGLWPGELKWKQLFLPSSDQLDSFYHADQGGILKNQSAIDKNSYDIHVRSQSEQNGTDLLRAKWSRIGQIQIRIAYDGHIGFYLSTRNMTTLHRIPRLHSCRVNSLWLLVSEESIFSSPYQRQYELLSSLVVRHLLTFHFNIL